jgi:hypothetical protein
LIYSGSQVDGGEDGGDGGEEGVIAGLRDGTPECGDGLDNDLDGLVDWPEDIGCESASDVNETLTWEEFTPRWSVSELEQMLWDSVGNDFNGGYNFLNCPGNAITFEDNPVDSYVCLNATARASIRSYPYAYVMRDYLEMFAAMYEATGNITYLDQGMYYAGLMEDASMDWDGNGFREFINCNSSESGTCNITEELETINNLTIVELYVNRGARGMTKVIEQVKRNGLEDRYAIFDTILNFVEHDTLGQFNYHYFVAPRNTAQHITSHFASVLLDLYLITGNETYLNNTKWLYVNQMVNLTVENQNYPGEPKGYLDLALWCDSWGVSNVPGYTCHGTDTGHNADTIAFIGRAYRLKEQGIIDFNYTDDQIYGVIRNFKGFMWDKNLNYPIFLNLLIHRSLMTMKIDLRDLSLVILHLALLILKFMF